MTNDPTLKEAMESGNWEPFFDSMLTPSETEHEPGELDYDPLEQMAEEMEPPEPEEYGETLTPQQRNPSLGTNQ